jgi:hypothetical protein
MGRTSWGETELGIVFQCALLRRPKWGFRAVGAPRTAPNPDQAMVVYLID